MFWALPGYFLRTPDNSNFFRFPLKVRVIGSRLYWNKRLCERRKFQTHTQTTFFFFNSSTYLWTFQLRKIWFKGQQVSCIDCVDKIDWPPSIGSFCILYSDEELGLEKSGELLNSPTVAMMLYQLIICENQISVFKIQSIPQLSVNYLAIRSQLSVNCHNPLLAF